MKIFISYSAPDQWFADKIVELLGQLGVSMWYDKVDVFIGDNILQKIQSGLQECTHLIVILSNKSIGSKWVKEELETFYYDFVEGGKTKVYPFLLEDVQSLSPLFLKKYKYADFRRSTPQALNPEGVAEVEKEFRGITVLDGEIFRCYRTPDEHRIQVYLPQGKTKTQINAAARQELETLRPKLAGTHVLVTGRITYTLALMIGAYLGNICKSLQAYDPKGDGGHEFVPVFLPS